MKKVLSSFISAALISSMAVGCSTEVGTVPPEESKKTNQQVEKTCSRRKNLQNRRNS